MHLLKKQVGQCREQLTGFQYKLVDWLSRVKVKFEKFETHGKKMEQQIGEIKAQVMEAVQESKNWMTHEGSVKKLINQQNSLLQNYDLQINEIKKSLTKAQKKLHTEHVQERESIKKMVSNVLSLLSSIKK